MNYIFLTLLVGTNLISLEAHAMKGFQLDSLDSRGAPSRVLAGSDGSDDGYAASVSQSQAGVAGGGTVTDEQVEALYSGSGSFQDEDRKDIRAELEKLTPEARESVVKLARSLPQDFQYMEVWDVTDVIAAISKIADGDVCRAVADFVPIFLGDDRNPDVNGRENIIIETVERAGNLLSPLSQEDRRAVIGSAPKLFTPGLSTDERFTLISVTCSVPEVIEEIVDFVEALGVDNSQQEFIKRLQLMRRFAGTFTSVPKEARKLVAKFVPQIFTRSEAQPVGTIRTQLEAIDLLRSVPMDVIELVAEAGARLSQEGKHLLSEDVFLMLGYFAQEYSDASFRSIVNSTFKIFNDKNIDSQIFYNLHLRQRFLNFVNIPSQNRVCMVEAESKFLKTGMELDRVRDITRTLRELACDDSKEGREGMLDAVVTAHSQIITAEADEDAVYGLLKALASLQDCDVVHRVAQYASQFISPNLPDHIRVSLVELLGSLPPYLLGRVVTAASPCFLKLQAQDFPEDNNAKMEEDCRKYMEAYRNLERTVDLAQEELRRLPSDWTWEGYLKANPGLRNLFGRKGNEEKSKEEILLDHYLNWGQAGGLRYLPRDWTWQGYLAANPKLSNMFDQKGNEGKSEEEILRNHYLEHGQEGGLRYLPSDWTWEGYLAANPGLRNLFGREGSEGKSKEEILRHHYLNWGQKSNLNY